MKGQETMAATANHFVRLTQIACIRGDRLLFEQLSLSLTAGAALRITGPNGAGKSSLLRLIGGLLAPAAGTVEISGRVALMNEQLPLEPGLPLVSALGQWARLDVQKQVTVAAALAEVALTELAAVPVRLLSTGQRRRAALAMTLATRADIWLLDEPANGLDHAATVRLEASIARHRRAGGIILVATHQPLDLPDAQELAL
jgi:heme exporter protein A